MLIAPFDERQRRSSPMACRPAMLLGTIVALGTGCGTSAVVAPHQAGQPAATASAPAEGSKQQRTSPVEGRPGATLAVQMTEAERAIVVEATLPALLRIALARNPELAEASARLRAAREGDPAGSRLPDPEFEYQLWAQPLGRPYALDEAQMHMFGIRQGFPAPGSRGARADAALSQANVALEARRAREQDIALRVRRAFAEYYRAEREYRLHLEHARVAQQVMDLARAAYQGGRGSQQDLLRAALEMSRLHNDVAVIERDRRIARALLNTLMARAPDAPLGPPAALEPLAAERRYAELASVLATRRPEMVAAESAVRARASELEASRASARWPSFMVGLQYMYMPMESERQNYGVMFSMSLPWFNSAHAEAVRAAEAKLDAERSALTSTRYAATYELYEATERLKSARESLAIIERGLLPLAQQSFESAEAAYRGGQQDLTATFDALRSLLDVRIERERALVQVDVALADLERAAGGDVAAVSRKMEHE
jgi:outer membrane protein, heavy metal efflux system